MIEKRLEVAVPPCSSCVLASRSDYDYYYWCCFLSFLGDSPDADSHHYRSVLALLASFLVLRLRLHRVAQATRPV